MGNMAKRCEVCGTCLEHDYDKGELFCPFCAEYDYKKLCPHLKAFAESIHHLDINLNDGFNDNFICLEHDQAVRIEDEGMVRFTEEWSKV